jgi:Clp amino terminal domain, pathogenicity island component
MTRSECLGRAAEEAAGDDEPMRALEALVGLRAELESAIRIEVSRALEAGSSFGDLARVLGISRQAAHRRFRDLSPRAPVPGKQRLVVTEPAARVLRLARDEAVRSDAAALASEHVLIAVLRSGGREARRLGEHGVTVAAARAAAAEAPSERPPDPQGPTAGVRRVLQNAKLIATARGERKVAVSALLLAALDDSDNGAPRVLTALGVSVAQIRAQLSPGSRTVRRIPSGGK